MYRAYQKACDAKDVQLGEVQVFDLGGLVGGPRWIINFPTKGHWKARSRLKDIESGLADLTATVEHLGIRSIALPPLGCGNGGLDWGDVLPRIKQAFSKLPDVEVLVFPPTGAPEAATMPANRTSENDNGSGDISCSYASVSQRYARSVCKSAGDSQADVFPESSR